MTPPTFEQIDPWARRISKLASFCVGLGAVNIIVIFFMDPDISRMTRTLLTVWWVPIAAADALLQYVMIRWALARLRAFEREHPDLFP